MESSTEILRKLLDERGVEYEAERIDSSNYFTWGENDCYSYTEYPDGTVLRIWDCTPEQAIAATLGRRTCEYAIKDNMNETEGMGDVWIECSACHCAFDYYADEWLMNMHYCPNCGAKVVEQ